MDNYIEIQEANKLGVILTKDNLEYAEHLKNQYKIFQPFGELVPLVGIRYYDTKYHYHDFIIVLKYNNIYMQPVNAYKENNKYIFRLPNPYRHRHLEYFKCRLDAPNKIGTPTAKKIEDWFFYLTMKECQQKEHVRLHLEKENAYRAELAKLGSLVIWENENQAIIEKTNLCYTVFFNPGAIYTTLKIVQDYKISLNRFLEMINYQSENENNK